MKVCSSTGMLPLQNLDRKWMFVDGFHRLPGSFSLFYVCGCTLPDQYYCEFLWSWEKFLWRWSTVQPKNTVCHSSSKGKCSQPNRMGPYTNDWKRVTKRMVDFDHFEKVHYVLFWKVVGDRFYSSRVLNSSTLWSGFWFLQLDQRDQLLGGLLSNSRPVRSTRDLQWLT